MTKKSKIDKASDLVRLYHKIFKSEEGEQILFDIMNHCGMLDATFTSNAGKMAYNQGKRSVCVYILSRLDTDPREFRRQMEEALEQDNYLNLED